MRVDAVRGTNFRCYRRLELALQPGLVGVVGPNGAGKTSLLELIHFGCLGYSPRTSNDRRLVTFDAQVLRAEVDALLASGPVSAAVGYRAGRAQAGDARRRPGADDRAPSAALPGARVHP